MPATRRPLPDITISQRDPYGLRCISVLHEERLHQFEYEFLPEIRPMLDYVFDQDVVSAVLWSVRRVVNGLGPR